MMGSTCVFFFLNLFWFFFLVHRSNNFGENYTQYLTTEMVLLQPIKIISILLDVNVVYSPKRQQYGYSRLLYFIFNVYS